MFRPMRRSRQELARQETDDYTESYPDIWDSGEKLLTMKAALLHDVGHGAS